MPSHHRAKKPVALALAACVVAVPFLTAVPANAVPSDGVVASGDDWSVTAVAGGYEITLDLDEQLPVRSASPSLVSESGQDLGPAVESADGLSLSLFTTDPAAAQLNGVDLGWDGVAAGESGASSAARSLRATPTDASDAAVSAVLDADPSDHGSFTVARADYDLGDQAIDLAGIGGIKGELTGAVYYPAEKTTASPVVMFLHGRHTSCAGGTANPDRWPCGPGQTNIPSYLGYDDTAEVLASNGYVVVSIAANAINSNDNQLADDRGALARAQLVLDSLDLLADANAGKDVGLNPVLTGRLDLGHVGLMGHSRGGDGVVRAALLNATRETPYNIEAVLPLAPTDFGRMTLPDVPMAVILPYCDGDVVNLQGQHFIDDSRYAFDDSVLRSSVLMMGTNHNYFNTIWTPSIYPTSSSDDWRAQDRNQVDPVCGYGTAESRLTDTEQRDAGTAYMSAFFRLTMGEQDEFLPLFDGSDSTVESAGRADVRVTASQPEGNRASIAALTAPTSRVTAAGSATAQVCASLSGRPIAGSLPYCSTTLTSSQAPHWTPATYAPSVAATPVLNFVWSANSGQLKIPVPSALRDASSFTNLAFKIAPNDSVVGSTDLRVAVVDGRGATAELTLSEFDDALTVLPGTATPLRKTLLQNVQIPLADLADRISVTDIREIRLLANTASGGVYLSDVAFETPGLGTPAISTRPTVSVVNTIVEEGAGPGEAQVAVLLDRPAESRVVAEVSGIGAATAVVGSSLDTVVFEPGDRCATVTVPLAGNSTPGTAAVSRFQVVASVLQNATMGQPFGALSVREDDGVTSGSELPPVGVQGDACAEALAAQGELTLAPAPTAPGDAVTVTGSGFRSGESVALSFHSDPVDLGATVSADGTVSFTTAVPAEAEFGSHEFRAVGAGSGLTAVAAVQLDDPDVPQPGADADADGSGSDADADGGNADSSGSDADADTAGSSAGADSNAASDSAAGANAAASGSSSDGSASTGADSSGAAGAGGAASGSADAAGSTDAAGSPDGVTAGEATGSGLAATGAAFGGILAAAVILLAAGLLLSRRRREEGSTTP
ncbi:MAG: hypothetical protein ACTJHU_00785 [Mycetocola sp.]